MYLSNMPPATDAGDVIFRESPLNTSCLSRSAWAKSLLLTDDSGPLGSFWSLRVMFARRTTCLYAKPVL